MVVVYLTSTFKKTAKRLSKKYRPLKKDLLGLITELEENPVKGIKIGENTYKIRLAVKSKGKGKSGGLRVITFLYSRIADTESQEVYLLDLFDKSDLDNLPKSYIQNLVPLLEQELTEQTQEEE